MTAITPPNPITPPPTTSPSASSLRHDNVWIWQVTALCVGLGVMLALAVRTTSRIKRTGISPNRFGVSAAVVGAYREQAERLEREIAVLRNRLKEYQLGASSTSKNFDLLRKQMAEQSAMAGLAAVEGPGVKVQLKDSEEQRLPGLPVEEYDNYLIHDIDINGICSELKAAGAEALAISGADTTKLQRVVVTTTARCVGPNAIVNGVQVSAPYTIYAIGNPKELRSALEMPNGFIQSRGLDVLKMITIEESDHLVLPQYAGSFSPRYARPSSSGP